LTDLYPTLLRDVDAPQYGATLKSIVELGERGKQMARKLIVTIDGAAQPAIECSAVNVAFEDDTVVVKVSTLKNTGFSKNTGSDGPSVDGLQPLTSTKVFRLMGDDLDAFMLLSDFRLEANKTEKIPDQSPRAVTIESETYDIQDLSAIQNASLDLIDKERRFLDDGYLVHSASEPRYEYEDANHFKLIETAVLFKADTAEVSTEN